MSLKTIKYQPGFIEGGKGRIFTFVCRAAHRSSSGRKGVLLIPPFAEEMNKSRRMLTQQAKLLAARGYDAVLPDLFGTGDSEGDFLDARWEVWCDDLESAYHALWDEGMEAVNILALRTGALLIPDLLEKKGVTPGRVVLWQPVISGEQFLSQFFRLRLAAGMVYAEKQRSSGFDIKKELQERGYTEIAGYGISKELVEAMQNKKLVELVGRFSGELHWCEVSSNMDRPMNALNRNVIDEMQAAGIQVHIHKVSGHPFWGAGATAIEDVPALLDTTCQIFSGK